ncbi:MAG TPA: polysaccharide biosynthesis C-terminal domain-containing protein [Lachnospiraceae bacterium]|nr:polysaccharide biosynthesis C-terminal domain-containing protein [Lachnospiraceae bacterium]
MNQTEIKKKQLLLFIRIFGLVTILLLINLIGNLGMVYFAASLELYLLLCTVFIDHVPEYMEKMVRCRMGKEQYRNADKVSKTVMIYCLVAGLLISLLLFLISDLVASNVFLMKEAAIVLKMLAPAFFFSALGAALQGYFQGMGSAMPSIIYHVVKQLFSLTFSLLFGYILLQYGKNVSALLQNDHYTKMYGAAGVALGVTVAAVLADLFLFIIYIGAGRRARNKKQDGMRLTEDGLEVGKQFIRSMLPASAYNAILRFPILIGLLFYVRKLGNDESLYGAFYVQYLVMCGILIYGALLLIMNKESVLIHLVKREEIKNAKNYLTSGIQALLIFTCFFASMTFVLSSSLLKVLFSDQTFTDQITKSMQLGAVIIILFPISQYIAGILIGIGKKRTAFTNVLISLMLSVVAVMSCAPIIKNDILAIVIGFVVFSLIDCLLNAFFLFRILHYSPDWLRGIVLPVLASLITGACVFLLRNSLVALTGDFLAMMIGLLIGSFCYMILLFVSKCIREKDLSLIPCGEAIRKIGRILHLI